MDEKNVTEINALNKGSFTNKINDLIRSPKSIKFFEVCFFLLFCFQIIMIIYVNLFQNQYHLGYDASTYFLNSIEAWKQKSLILDNWEAQTTLNLDSSMPLAALLYGICGNIFISYGIANINVTALFVILLIDILRKMDLSVLSSLIVLNFFLTPYINTFFNNANPLDYFSIIFVSSSMYAVKMFICTLVFDIVLSFEIGKTGIKTNVMLVVAAILVFVSGLSSGLYVVVTVLLPFVVYVFFKAFKSNNIADIFNKTLLIVISLIIIAILGKFVSAKIIGFTSNENNMVLTGADNFWSNIGSIFLGFFLQMGALWIYSDVNIFSVAGVNLLINWALVIVVFSSVLYSVYCSIKKRNTNGSVSYEIASSVTVINLLIFVVSYTTYGAAYFEVRYLIPLFIISCFAVGITHDKLKMSLFKASICAMTFVLLSFTNVLSYYNYNKTRIEEVVYEIPKKVSTYSCPVIYGYGDDIGILVRDLRAIDASKVYKLVTGNGNSAHHWGDYTYYDDLSEYDGEIVLLSTEESFKILPEYLKNQFVLTDTSGHIGIYVADRNCFDLETGFPDKKGERAVEKAYSSGIATAGEIKADGCFYSDGTEGYVMYGPYINANAGTYDVVLKYEIISSVNENAGVFDVSCNTGITSMASETINASKNELVLHNIIFEDDAVGVEYRVYAYKGTEIRVDSIEIICI